MAGFGRPSRAVLVAAVIAAAGVGAFVVVWGAVSSGLDGSGGDGADRSAVSRNAERAAGGGAVDRGGLDRGEGGPRDGATRSGLERLRLAADAAGRADSASLGSTIERARAWADEHAGDLPPRSREVFARLASLFEDLLEGRGGAAARYAAFSDIRLHSLFGDDLDGDGAVTEAEIGENLDRDDPITGRVFEYLRESLGNGGAPIERDALVDGIWDARRRDLASVVERASWSAWDANGDGFVSDAERAAGLIEAGGDPETVRADAPPR